MRRTVLTAALAAGVVFGGVGPAFAQNSPGSVRDVPDTNQVVVFSNEFLPLEAYPDPHGCHRLPVLTHLVNNETSRIVHLHADPFCLTPGVPVLPGHGMHTGQFSGSFSS
ncbi:hypothetical protein ACF09J_31095 [Streptomyces sp. NPDC014889]|uniref:hypothetical protein n=1 Tax=Streptomyces sp. NPDC014889 TaxID=3364928 RepID=UPI0036F631DB